MIKVEHLMMDELATCIWIVLDSKRGGALLDRVAGYLDLQRIRRRFWFDEGDGSLRRRCTIRLAEFVRALESIKVLNTHTSSSDGDGR